MKKLVYWFSCKLESFADRLQGYAETIQDWSRERVLRDDDLSRVIATTLVNRSASLSENMTSNNALLDRLMHPHG